MPGDPALQEATAIGLDNIAGRVSGLQLQVSPAGPVDVVLVESLANTMLPMAPTFSHPEPFLDITRYQRYQSEN